MRLPAIAAILLLSASEIPAQFKNLASTDNGDQLYFSSSFRLRGTSEFSHEKIFRNANGGFQLYAQREFTPPTDSRFSNYYRLIEPDVSGDGRIVSYVAERDCIPQGSGCLYHEYFQSTISGAGSQVSSVLEGQVQLSRNGRYALQSKSSFGIQQLIDLTTGASTTIADTWAYIAPHQAVSGSGMVVYVSLDGLYLWSGASSRRIAAPEPPGDPTSGDSYLSNAIIDAQGRWVIYESATQTDSNGKRILTSFKLRSIDLQTGRQATLAAGLSGVEAAPPIHYDAAITNDGRTVLYVMPAGSGKAAQVFLTAPDGSNQRQLTSAPEGIAEATISGNGNVVYAVTETGRLLRIDIVTGMTRELTPRTPVITGILGINTQDTHGAPGSLIWLTGKTLSSTTQVFTDSLPQTLGGVQVKLGGILTRLLLVSPNEIRLQIPFETPLGDQEFAILPADSPFEQGYRLGLNAAAPHFLRWGAELPPRQEVQEPVIVHTDWSSLVSNTNPAQLGEIVHLYMTGLGPVAPQVPSGQAAPVAPLSVTTLPFSCVSFLNGVQTPVRVLYSGLAPDFFGIYQVDLAAPRQITDSINGMAYALIKCSSGTSVDFADIPLRPAP